jgi:hypothetical protein
LLRPIAAQPKRTGGVDALTKINAAEKAPADIGACVFSSFQSKRPGAEARCRLREYGPNRIEKIAQWHPELRLLGFALFKTLPLTQIQALFVECGRSH